MRVLITGASGQVGKALLRCAPEDVEIVAPSSANLNLLHPDALSARVRDVAPHAIINCAAFTRVDDAEGDSSAAFAINEQAPRALAMISAELGARLLHISTDYVFSGSGTPPFDMSASPQPLNVYGTSKLAGERAVLEANGNASVVRTAWVHSGAGVNFIATAVRVLNGGNVMRVVDDQVSTPTRASNLARALWRLVELPTARGLVHFTDAGVASWYDVAQCVLETMQANGKGQGASVVPVASATFPRPAPRPGVSLLDKHDSWSRLDFTPPHWREGVIASTLEVLNA